MHLAVLIDKSVIDAGAVVVNLTHNCAMVVNPESEAERKINSGRAEAEQPSPGIEKGAARARAGGRAAHDIACLVNCVWMTALSAEAAEAREGAVVIENRVTLIVADDLSLVVNARGTEGVDFRHMTAAVDEPVMCHCSCRKCRPLRQDRLFRLGNCG